VTGRWYPLQTLVLENLGRGKTADGLQAAEWLKAGEFDKVAEYCRNDVAVERDICDMALRGEVLRLPAMRDSKTPQGPLTLRLEPVQHRWHLAGDLDEL
jgi:DEAD/DEAH box helicase domain-containing protein